MLLGAADRMIGSAGCPALNSSALTRLRHWRLDLREFDQSVYLLGRPTKQVVGPGVDRFDREKFVARCRKRHCAGNCSTESQRTFAARERESNQHARLGGILLT